MTAVLPRLATPEDILSLVQAVCVRLHSLYATPENIERFRVSLKDLATERNLDFDPSAVRFIPGFCNEVYVTESGIERGFKLFSWPPYAASQTLNTATN